MLKKFIISIFVCFLFLTSTVFAEENIEVKEEVNYENYFLDEGNIFHEVQKTELLDSIKTFYERTNIFVFLHTVEKLQDETIDSLANYNYPTMFPENDVLYILMSKQDGDMIIKYGEQDSEIVTDELISVMMMSVEADFNQGNVLEGLKAALFNGMVLIEENLAINQDTHEVYEKDESEGFNYILVCIGCAVVFVFNCFFLFSPKKEAK